MKVAKKGRKIRRPGAATSFGDPNESRRRPVVDNCNVRASAVMFSAHANTACISRTSGSRDPMSAG